MKIKYVGNLLTPEIFLNSGFKRKIPFSNRDIHALLKVSDTSWSKMMRFSDCMNCTWATWKSFVQQILRWSYWVERWWKRRLSHQLVGYLWLVFASLPSHWLYRPKVCQKNVPPHWKILLKERILRKAFCYRCCCCSWKSIFLWYQIRQKSPTSRILLLTL